MAINIKNPEVEQSIRTLAQLLGVDLTQAIGSAVQHELDRTRRSATTKLSAMRAATRRISELPDRDTRSADEILGYDSLGLPR